MERIGFDDLMDSDEIIYRNHRGHKVVVSFGLKRFMNQFGGKPFEDYNSNLIHKKDKRFDIVKVIRNGEIIYIENGFIKDEIKALKKQKGQQVAAKIQAENIIKSANDKIDYIEKQLSELEDMMDQK